MSRFALLVLASLICSTLPLPWQAASVLFSVPAVVVGVLAVRNAVRARLRAPVVAFTAAGVVMAGFLLVGQAATLVFWPLQVDRQECLADALSRSAERQCEQDYQRRIEETFFPTRDS